MKELKLIIPIFLILMFIPFYVNAETCDTNKIIISSITVEEESDNVEELSETTVDGKNINLNLSMKEVGDNITYKIVVKNDSKEDYELDENSFNLNSNYINYTFESEDDTNIVKKNSSKVVYLKVKYANEVPDEAFESGTYNDNQTMKVNLSTGDTISVPDTLKNPNTGVQSYILIVFIILLISITVYVLLKNKKYAKFMILIIGATIVIPISVYALCKCEIKIESKIEIKKVEEFKSFCYVDYSGGGTGNKLSFNYKENETFNDFLDRGNNFEYINYNDFYFIPNTCFTVKDNNVDVEVDNICFNNNWGANRANQYSLIINESEGCYFSGGG